MRFFGTDLMDTVKEAAANAIDSNAGELNFISQEIWLHPELGFVETRAHQTLTDYLEKNGFAVERHHIVETGFRAVYGSRKGGLPNIAVLCEYDALPEIGHACGHNLIAEVGVATALGIKAAFQAADKPLGQVDSLSPVPLSTPPSIYLSHSYCPRIYVYLQLH